MVFERLGRTPLDYQPVRYGPSKLTFRGPARDLSGDYVACLVGTETHGKFIDRPWPARLEAELGVACVNFGLPNAGPDVLLRDTGLLDLACGASSVVVQVPCAMNLSNPYYDVHPRRNDRFVSASARLRRLYPEVDFTEFHFTRHMIRRLATLAPDVSRCCATACRISGSTECSASWPVSTAPSSCCGWPITPRRQTRTPRRSATTRPS